MEPAQGKWEGPGRLLQPAPALAHLSACSLRVGEGPALLDGARDLVGGLQMLSPHPESSVTGRGE